MKKMKRLIALITLATFLFSDVSFALQIPLTLDDIDWRRGGELLVARGPHETPQLEHELAGLERFGLAEVANKVVRGFSKGMAQRTALAHAMAVQPRLLILDEPLSGLDPIGRRDVIDILSEYRQQGGTILLTSHVLHDVERLADRFGLIHKGELRAVKAPGERRASGPSTLT